MIEFRLRFIDYDVIYEGQWIGTVFNRPDDEPPYWIARQPNGNVSRNEMTKESAGAWLVSHSDPENTDQEESGNASNIS